jgi:hypothetical protein
VHTSLSHRQLGPAPILFPARVTSPPVVATHVRRPQALPGLLRYKTWPPPLFLVRASRLERHQRHWDWNRHRCSSPSAVSSSRVCFSCDWWSFPHSPLSTGAAGPVRPCWRPPEPHPPPERCSHRLPPPPSPLAAFPGEPPPSPPCKRTRH